MIKDFSIATIGKRVYCLKGTEENNLNSRILYKANLSFKKENKIKTFPDK